MDSSLETRIKRALDSTASLDDTIVAEQVLRDLTSAEKDALLARAVLRTAPAIRAERTRRAARRVAHSTATSGHSLRNNDVRANWQRFCNEVLLLADGRAIRCGDATVRDLRRAAQDRREAALALTNEASRWDRIADALVESGCARIEDMPPQVIWTTTP